MHSNILLKLNPTPHTTSRRRVAEDVMTFIVEYDDIK